MSKTAINVRTTYHNGIDDTWQGSTVIFTFSSASINLLRWRGLPSPSMVRSIIFFFFWEKCYLPYSLGLLHGYPGLKIIKSYGSLDYLKWFTREIFPASFTGEMFYLITLTESTTFCNKDHFQKKKNHLIIRKIKKIFFFITVQYLILFLFIKRKFIKN